MVTLEKPIATGRTAKGYAYGEGKVLKLFYPTTPLLGYIMEDHNRVIL